MTRTVITRMPRAAIEAVRYVLQKGSRNAARAALQDLAPLRVPHDDRDHLQETVQWIFRAHDAGEDQGVSRSYSLRRHRRYECTGWLPSYPETTGYIIPTLYEIARTQDWPEAADRAERMARWEVEIQMDTGAVRGGTVADDPSPAVFNTGQVLFGWVRAAEETKDPVFDEASARAARWLVDCQDPDGAWRRGASKFAAESGHVYNTRVAWALALYARRSGDSDANAAARRSCEFALARQNEKGWYAENCLDDQAHPLVHTIAYAAQGLLETGLIQDDERFVDAARKTAVAVADVQHDDGFLAGRLDQDWRESAEWSCLTGNSQMALIWSRLAALDKSPVFKEAANRAVHFVLSTQRLDAANPGMRGGVAGSYPVWGHYGTFEYLNWAAKFTLDALLGRMTEQPGGTAG